MMALIFTLNQEGAVFMVKVSDCTSSTVIDRANISDQKIIFYKPDGTRIEKDATLEVDPQDNTQSFVHYQEPTGTTILDQIGSWEYDAEITLIPGNVVETSQRRVFWVK